MTFTEVSTSNENTVCSHLKGFQNVFKGNGRRAHDSNSPHIGWVLETTHASQISTCIGAPVTKKGQNLGFKIRHALSFCVSIFSQQLRLPVITVRPTGLRRSVGVVEYQRIGKTYERTYFLIDALLHNSSTLVPHYS